MEFSLGLLLICIGIAGTVISLIYLIKSLQAVDTAIHSDIDEIATVYTKNRNDSETESSKKSVPAAQTPVHLDTASNSQEHLHQNNEIILDENSSHISQEPAIYHGDEETVLDEDSPNHDEEQNIYHEDDETVLDDDDASPDDDQCGYRDDDETVLVEDTLTEIELLK